MQKNIAYHLQELALAQNPEADTLPGFPLNGLSVLDIGCGIGQTLAESRTDKDGMLVGIDIDFESLAYGKQKFPQIMFYQATAEQVPFPGNTFDVVISRVTLPYTNIPLAMSEIARVLRPQGRVWLTLHSFDFTWQHLKHSVCLFHFKDILFRAYVILNGLVFLATGKVFSFPPNRRIESFQCCRSIKNCMQNNGFTEIITATGDTFVCTARKAAL